MARPSQDGAGSSTDRIAELESANARLRDALESSRRVGVAIGFVMASMRGRGEQSSDGAPDERFVRAVDEVRASLGNDFDRLIKYWADRLDSR